MCWRSFFRCRNPRPKCLAVLVINQNLTLLMCLTSGCWFKPVRQIQTTLFGGLFSLYLLSHLRSYCLISPAFPFSAPRRNLESICHQFSQEREINAGTGCELLTVLSLRVSCLKQFFFHFQNEGCDGVLGSSAVIDKCGVCGGRDSSCQKVTGSFQNVTVPLGYHKILDIPMGATFINITERRASPNYLGEN